MSTPTNITLASVGSYCSINHITVNGSYINNFNTTFDPSFINLEDNSGWSFYGDLAVVAAIERINSDPTILPGIHVNLKRFTDCGGYDPEAALLYDGKSGGYAAAVTAMDVADVHTDVIGVVGNEFSSAVIGIGEILSLYQLPFCGNCATSPRFSDKNKYPYYWRPLPPVTGDSYLLVLKTWNVKRVAIVYEKDSELGLSSAQIVHQSLVRGKIEVITSIALPSDLDKAAYDVSSKALKTFHSRYVIVLGSNPFIGSTVYRLSKSGLNPTEMVYLSENALQHFMDPLITLGPDYYNVIRGFIWVTNPVNPVHQVVKQMQAEVSKVAGAEIPFEYVSRIYLTQAYDCVMMMLLGFHKLLQENPEYTAEMLQNRQLQRHMNWILFKDLEYNGLTWDEMRLNPTGDLELPIILYRYTGDHLNVTSFALSNLDWTEFIEYNKTAPIFHNNSTVPPPDGPKPLTHYSNTVTTHQGILLAILASIGTIATVSLAALVVSFRNNKAVRRAAIPEILTFIGGCNIGYTSLWFYIGDPTASGCKARVVLVAVSYVCMVASLTLRSLFMVAIFLSGKAYRNSKALKNVQARFWGYLALFVAIEVMLVTVWCLTTKMRIIEMGTDEFTYTQCIEISTTAGSTIMVLMQVLHTLLFALLLYTLYQHKHIKSESAQDHLTTLVLTAQTLIICIVIVQGLAGTNSAPNVETDPRVAICMWAVITCLLLKAAAPLPVTLFSDWAEKRRTRLRLAKLASSSSQQQQRSTANNGISRTLSRKGGGVPRRHSSLAIMPGLTLYRFRLIQFTSERCIVRFAVTTGCRGVFWWSSWFLAACSVHCLRGEKVWLSIVTVSGTRCFTLKGESAFRVVEGGQVLELDGSGCVGVCGGGCVMQIECKDGEEAGHLLDEVRHALQELRR